MHVSRSHIDPFLQQTLNNENTKKSVKIIKYKISDFEQEISKSSNQFKVGSIVDFDPFNYEHDCETNTRQMRHIYQQPQLKIASYNLTSLNNNFANQFTSNHEHYKAATGSDSVRSDLYNDDYMGRIARLNADIKISVFKAIYDYDGKEEDELSFRDGDKFFNCEQIDVGWMIGVHEKTGKHGMFPSNYAEPIDFF